MLGMHVKAFGIPIHHDYDLEMRGLIAVSI